MIPTRCIVDAEKDANMKSLSQEEAIAILSDMKIDIPVPKAAVTQKKRNVALDMAISALSCSEIPNSSDSISRRAAIDAIANCTNCGDEKTLRAYVEKHNLDNKWAGGVLEAIDALCDLPSAQLQYEELTPEEAASEIACGSIMSAWHWLDVMMQLKQMGYAICRKR